MRILKILGVIFLIYFIKRFVEMYRVMKRIQEQQDAKKPQNGPPQKDKNVIDADYKVMD